MLARDGELMINY